MTERLLARSAAALLLLSLLTGGAVGLLAGHPWLFDEHTLLAAHVAGLLGCVLLLGVGWTLPLLSYVDEGRRRLAWAFIAPSYANWALTAAKSFLKVRGIARTGAPANDAVFALLWVCVVLPYLAASAAWIIGLRGKS